MKLLRYQLLHTLNCPSSNTEISRYEGNNISARRRDSVTISVAKNVLWCYFSLPLMLISSIIRLLTIWTWRSRLPAPSAGPAGFAPVAVARPDAPTPSSWRFHKILQLIQKIIKINNGACVRRAPVLIMKSSIDAPMRKHTGAIFPKTTGSESASRTWNSRRIFTIL